MKFKYRGRSSDSQIVEGELEADNQGLALQSLQQQGMMVMSLNQVSGVGAALSSSAGKSLTFFDKLQRIGTVPAKNKMVFFRSLSLIIRLVKF